MNGHQNEAFSYLIGALNSPRKVNGYGADYAVNAHGLHEIKKNVLVEVIFGCRISEEDKAQIRALVKSNGFNSVPFSEAKANPEAYKLDIQPYMLL